METLPRRRNGFSLIEILLGLVIAVPLIYGLALLAVAVVRASADERVRVSVTLPGATSPTTVVAGRGASSTVEADAVIYHAALAEILSQSTATYVFGAENVGLSSSTAGSLNLGPLRTASWVDLEVSNSQRTARDFLLSYRSALGDAQPYWSPETFSLVVVGPVSTGARAGHAAISAIAQVLCLPVIFAGKGEPGVTVTLQWARLWTAQGYFEYAWTANGGGDGKQSWKPWAAQYWLRADEARNLFDPGPAVCRFPDPASADEVSVGLSRFSYAL